MKKKFEYDLKLISELDSNGFTTRQIAQRIGCSQATLVQWLQRNTIKTVVYKLKTRPSNKAQA